MNKIVYQTVENVLLPIGTRLGSLVSGALIYYGVQNDHAMNLGGLIQTGVVIGGLVAVDLVLAYVRKKQVQAKAVANGN